MPTPVIDFARSYVTFFTKPHQGSNIARILIDATCTVHDERTGESDTCYLIAPCRSERMYQERALFQMPNYEFCGIWTAEEFAIIRRHWTSDRDNVERGRNRNRFDRVEIDIRPLAEPQPLAEVPQIVEATLANRSLVARTTLHDEQRGLRFVLEYPIKTMNVTREPPRFQVDTGPLLVPNLDSDGSPALLMSEIGHVAYDGFAKAEFIVRRPVPIGEGEQNPVAVTDYSVVGELPALNELFWGA